MEALQGIMQTDPVYVVADIGTEVTRKHTPRRGIAAPDTTAPSTYPATTPATREQYVLAYQATAPLYFSGQPDFEGILGKIGEQVGRL